MKLNRFDNFKMQPNDVEITVVTSSGGVNAGVVNYVETGSTATNLKAYGISVLAQNTTGTDNNKYVLDAPITGVMKTLTAGAVASASDAPVVYTGSTAITIQANSTAGILYVYLNSGYASCTLMGLSTALWGVVASHGTIVYSTST